MRLWHPQELYVNSVSSTVLFQPSFQPSQPHHHFLAQQVMRRLRPQEFQRQCCAVRRHEHDRRISEHRRMKQRRQLHRPEEISSIPFATKWRCPSGSDDFSDDPNTRARKRFVINARGCWTFSLKVVPWSQEYSTKLVSSLLFTFSQ